jgi:hypothetical protein
VRKLDNGDSQTWSSGPMDYDFIMTARQHYKDGGTWTWTAVLAQDTAGNTYEVRNPDFVPPPPYTA